MSTEKKHNLKVIITGSRKKYEVKRDGESVWVLVDDEAMAAYKRDEDGTTFECILDNDPIDYPSVKHGDVLTLTMMGRLYKPVIFLED